MSVTDVRRWSCDSCTTFATLNIASNMRSMPSGWVALSLTNESKANHMRYWCPDCVAAVTTIRPNALGEFATGWPHVRNGS